MTNATRARIPDATLVSVILERIARDLGTVLGQELSFAPPTATRAIARPAGEGLVHISFKLGLVKDGELSGHGTLLVPLPEAITMACLLLMMPEDSVAARREETLLDLALKDALLEISSMIAGAVNTALAELGASGWSVRTEGCQGVRAGVRPAIQYQEGRELVIGRATTCFEPYPTFEVLLILPPVD